MINQKQVSAGGFSQRLKAGRAGHLRFTVSDSMGFVRFGRRHAVSDGDAFSEKQARGPKPAAPLFFFPPFLSSRPGGPLLGQPEHAVLVLFERVHFLAPISTVPSSARN